jgi:predicted dehydrogenase
MDRAQAGTGAIGDLAAHIVDLGRFLVGEITEVSAMTRTFVEERPLPDGSGMGRVDVDDAFVAALAFDGGAMGSLEGTRLAAGRKNYELFEINGEKGSLRFNLERLNELQLYLVEEERPETEGFRTIMVTDATHPWIRHWWPPGHIIGWEHTFIHELAHFLDCIASDKPVAPDGATFRDGYRAALVCDAIVQSAHTRRQVELAAEEAA